MAAPHAAVQPQHGRTYKVIFDLSKSVPEPKEVLDGLAHAARLRNVFAADGLPITNFKVAGTFHGSAGYAAWQPLRMAIEKLLICYDWAESFVALNLVLKPLVDEVFMNHLSDLALRKGDYLLGQVFLLAKPRLSLASGMEPDPDTDDNRRQFAQHRHHSRMDREVASCRSKCCASVCSVVPREVRECPDATIRGCD
jgi:hypothetical protein